MSRRPPGDATRAKHLIVTADDFGLSQAVNEAVELAHTDGILSAASLMVAGDAAADAVARARQAAAEIRAQLAAFHATGLAVDHLNPPPHFHLHPTVQTLLLDLAREQRLPPLRLPVEPPGGAWRTDPAETLRRWLAWSFHGLRTRALRRRLRAAGVACNDACFGIWDSGRMDRARLAAAIAALPDGVSEIYCHPATRRSADQPASYQPVAELAALRDPTIRDLLARLGVRPVRFADLGAT